MRSRVLSVLFAIVMVPASGSAAVVQLRAIAAYEAYALRAQRTFLSRDRHAVSALRCDGVMPARPGDDDDDGIIHVPAGLVHHWRGSAFIRGAVLGTVVGTAHAYADYRQIYKEVMVSQLLSEERDTYRVLMRIKEGDAGVSAVLEIRSTIQYHYPTAVSAFAVSNADEIREVKNPGRGEQLLPAGDDSGYLWRASTLTYFLERPDGVYVEMETLGLSRRFPTLLGWLLEPIARRLGRRSIERSLQEFLAAVRSRARLPPSAVCE